MRRSATALKFLAPTALFLLPACYTYTESSLESISLGTQTRVVLDEDGFGRVVNQAASNGIPVENLDMARRGVSGRLMQLEPSNMLVELRGIGGAVYTAQIPVHAVQEVAVRSFSPKRTVLAVGGGLAISTLIYAGTVGGTTGPPGPPEEEFMSFPLFSFSFR